MSPKDRLSSPIQVFHVTDAYSPANPGVTAVIRQLTHYLAGNQWSTTVLTPGQAQGSVTEGVRLLDFPMLPGGRWWRYPKFMKAYMNNIGDQGGTVFHLHGVWGAPQWLAMRVAGLYSTPTILSAYGMLNPWQWNKTRLHYVKRMLYWKTLAYPAFRGLSLVHAVSPPEQLCLSRLFPDKRVELIPNAIDLEEVDHSLAGAVRETDPMEGKPYILFLGRLDPQKGVDILIEAFARNVIGKDFYLVIIGSDRSRSYTNFLKSLTLDRGVEERVLFLGPIFGMEKWKFYQNAWAGILPSRFDAISITSLEFAAAGIPTVTTHESGLFDWHDNGGILINPQIEEIEQALTQVFSWSQAERTDRGQKLRQLVERRYSWESVGSRWLKVYQELLGSRESNN